MSNKIDQTRITGFPPIAAANAHVLILGSMPSETSLRKAQYYGHQRNAFWPIMGELFGALPELDYQVRKQILMQNGVAVWDVLKSCMREGSMDADIALSSIETNDFALFFNNHPKIKSVFFNGETARKVYLKRVLPNLDGRYGLLAYHRLPSTSPAYATMKLAQKVDAWKVIKQMTAPV